MKAPNGHVLRAAALAATIIAAAFPAHESRAGDRVRQWRMNRRQPSHSGDFDEEGGGGSCAERDKAVARLLNGPWGALAHGPSADLKDVPYGDQARQKLDVFYPKAKDAAKPAPTIIMVHGGAWCVGDKALKGVATNKIARWLPKGFLFVSVNYPMGPDGSDALVQGGHIARAVAFVQKHAGEWGGDGGRVILMGHSAGGHLAALVNADKALRSRYGVGKILGTVSLDAGGLNIPVQMANVVRVMQGMYRDAFGKDESAWIKASPYHQLDRTAAPFLGVCSTRRPDDPCGQAKQYAQKSESLGVKARVLPQDKSHKAINAELGLPGGYTDAVEDFMAELDPVVKGLLKR